MSFNNSCERSNSFNSQDFITGIVPMDSLIFSLLIIKTGSDEVIIDKSFSGTAILFKVFWLLFFSTLAINDELLSFATASNGLLLVETTPYPSFDKSSVPSPIVILSFVSANYYYIFITIIDVSFFFAFL